MQNLLKEDNKITDKAQIQWKITKTPWKELVMQILYKNEKKTIKKVSKNICKTSHHAK